MICPVSDMNRTEVFSKLIVEGLHQWKDCPIPSMSYLKVLHRHNFHIEVYVDVSVQDDSDNHRVIEFIDLSHTIARYLREKYWSNEFNLHNFGNMSVENISFDIYEFLIKDGIKPAKIKVSEDDEMGVVKYF